MAELDLLDGMTPEMDDLVLGRMSEILSGIRINIECGVNADIESVTTFESKQGNVTLSLKVSIAP